MYIYTIETILQGNWKRYLCEPFGYGFLGHRMERFMGSERDMFFRYKCKRCGEIREVRWE